MPKPTVVVRHFEVSVSPSFTCEKCFATAIGSIVRIERSRLYWNLEDVVEEINSATISNTHMPVGWAGYGLYSHRCPRCKES